MMPTREASSSAVDLRMEAETTQLLMKAVDVVERHLRGVTELPVTREVSPDEVRDALRSYDFATPENPKVLIDEVGKLLSDWTVHTTHPRYFGLFNPSPALMGIVGDLLAAAFNPQLAVWSHAAAANEIEQLVLGFIGERIGYERDVVAGSFTTGGAEANLTAILLALTRHAPDIAENGLRTLPGDPVFYASQESHLAWLKIAHICGLGRNALRLVAVDDRLRMDVGELERIIEQDRQRGAIPFMVAATAGTTAAGTIDPLSELAQICAAHELAFHVDAAWGGAALLSDNLGHWLRGIEQADSVTIDAHKWLSVPMGAGMFLCQDAAGLNDVFRVATRYMPASVDATIRDQYTHSIQWSRRFIGLKVFLTLASIGRQGYEHQLEHDCELGDQLRQGLMRDGWRIENDTPLPVVCFTDPDVASERSIEHLHRIVEEVVSSGQAWISSVQLRETAAVRACIISHRTSEEDIRLLRAALATARAGAA